MSASDPAPADEWWATLEHPLAEPARALRAILLDAAPGVAENIKWKAPNYALADDFATFNFRRPTAVQVIFHTGAMAKPEHPDIVVDALKPVVRWADRNRAIVTFASAEQISDSLAEFETFARSWAAQLV